MPHYLCKPVALFTEQSFIPVHAELKNNTLFPVETSETHTLDRLHVLERSLTVTCINVYSSFALLFLFAHLFVVQPGVNN